MTKSFPWPSTMIGMTYEEMFDALYARWTGLSTGVPESLLASISEKIVRPGKGMWLITHAFQWLNELTS
jgi:hypothetical protein